MDGVRLPESIVAEVAVAHGRSGHDAGERNPVPLIFLFVIDEEEDLVLLDWAAERCAELIEIEFLGVGGEEAARIQIGVAEELEEASMELSLPDLVVTRTVGPPRVPHSAE